MTQFRLIAGTNVGLRKNNEDNFIVCADLASQDWGIPVDYQNAKDLGVKGCILVVADGMGGQNAGEVASSIAVDTVREMFDAGVMPGNVTDSDEAIDDYLKKIVCEADIRIKRKTCEDPNTSGMGSTIVIAWIIGKRAHIAWLGDSRAYCIVKEKGIARLTTDHSYVQSLVDAGKITEEQAMHHPDSNIINRSLGDTSQKARPEVVSIELAEGEVILLCSDGLCGVCRDAVIGGIVEENISDLKKCREELITAALNSGGSDNITVAMVHICKCDNSSPSIGIKRSRSNFLLKRKSLLYSLCVVLLLTIAAAILLLTRPEISYRLDTEPDEVALYNGETRQLSVKYITLKNNVADTSRTEIVTDKCEWRSTVPQVASVSRRGLITAKGFDSIAHIIVVYGGCSDTIVVRVEADTTKMKAIAITPVENDNNPAYTTGIVKDGRKTGIIKVLPTLSKDKSTVSKIENPDSTRTGNN